mmetsp:Transcript_7641/g.47181  ORF Transcript_7641/g.47181 Transcript_7641/m.47181 type:complete len:200 (-) Transcript_7641:878-1477(-)
MLTNRPFAAPSSHTSPDVHVAMQSKAPQSSYTRHSSASGLSPQNLSRGSSDTTSVSQFLATTSAKSTTRWLYPHSLSYHATTLTMSSPMTMVSEASTVDDTSLIRKSTETSGSSQRARIPFMGPSAASRKALFTSSAVRPFFSTLTTKSTTDTLGVGTRSAIPFNFPFMPGRTRATAFAAPVEVGTMFKAAALARRRSL